MRDFEIVWLEPYDIADLDLINKKPGEKAYVSEAEALRSQDFRRARFSNKIEVRPLRHRPRPKKVERTSTTSVSALEVERLVKQTTAPLYERLDTLVEGQQQLILLLETYLKSGMGFSPPSRNENFSLSKSEGVRKKILKPPEEDWKIEIEELSLGNEIQTEQKETDVQDTLNKLKSFRRKNKE